MIIVKETRPTSRRNPGLIYAKALDRHAQIEQKLARYMNAWQKSRAALKRIEKRMDEAQAAMWDANAAYLDDSI